MLGHNYPLSYRVPVRERGRIRVIVCGASYVNGILGSWSHYFQDNLMIDVLLLAMMGLKLGDFLKTRLVS